MAWYDPITDIATSPSTYLTGGASILGGLGSLFSNSSLTQQPVTQASTMTPEQQAALAELLPQLMQQYQAGSSNYIGGPSYQLTEAPTNQYANQMGSALTRALSGESAYEITPEITEQYYQDVIYNPAMTEYENVTRPGMLESLGSLHSGSRANLERTSRQDLAQNLSSQRANLYYQDELARRQAAENAANRQISGLSAGNQMYQTQADIWQAANQLGLTQDQLNLMYQQAQLGESQIPMQNLLSALGLQTTENIVSPSTLQYLTGLMPSIGLTM